ISRLNLIRRPNHRRLPPPRRIIFRYPRRESAYTQVSFWNAWGAMRTGVGWGMKTKPSSLLAQFARRAAELYRGDLHRFLARRMHTPEDIEDLAQEVYIRLPKIDNGEFVQNPKAYILQTASNVEHDFREKDRRAQRYVIVDSQMADEVSAALSDGPASDPAK